MEQRETNGSCLLSECITLDNTPTYLIYKVVGRERYAVDIFDNLEDSKERIGELRKNEAKESIANYIIVMSSRSSCDHESNYVVIREDVVTIAAGKKKEEEEEEKKKEGSRMM